MLLEFVPERDGVINSQHNAAEHNIDQAYNLVFSTHTQTHTQAHTAYIDGRLALVSTTETQTRPHKRTDTIMQTRILASQKEILSRQKILMTYEMDDFRFFPTLRFFKKLIFSQNNKRRRRR